MIHSSINLQKLVAVAAVPNCAQDSRRDGRIQTKRATGDNDTLPTASLSELPNGKTVRLRPLILMIAKSRRSSTAGIDNEPNTLPSDNWTLAVFMSLIT